MFLSLILLISSALASSSVINAGVDTSNTHNFPSNIDSKNVAGLGLLWNATLCGPSTHTPMVYLDRVCVTDFGGCITCVNRDTGSVIFQKNISLYTGFPAGIYSRTMPTPFNGLLIMGTTAIKSILNPGYGAWVFAVNFTNGELVWKTKVSDFQWAIITGSPLLHGETLYFGLSSGESVAPIYPGYVCCSFSGRAFAINATDGAIKWNTPMIPAELNGVGKYSGAAVWSSTPILKGNYIYVTTGQLYQTSEAVANCSRDRPTDTTCVDSRVHFDSVVKIERNTGEIVGSFRASAADTWNLACLYGGAIPGCQAGPAYDYDITNIMYSERSKTIFASSKSGFLWALSDDLEVKWFSNIVRGSITGGYTWQGAFEDNARTYLSGVYLANNNGFALPITLFNRSTVTSGVWVKYDGNGNVKWITPTPNGDQAYGSVSLTNDVVFGSTHVQGLLVALSTADGSILWRYQTVGSVNAAAAIVDNIVYWGTGSSSSFSPGIVSQNKLLAFRI